MNGGKDFEAGLQRHAAPVQVPIGWQRKAELGRGVFYLSPSGSVLANYDHVKAYLLTDGTCKCGLECPLILHKVFNFDPGAAVKQRTVEDVRSDEDVTKLCIHKRKLLAVAALHRSMETHPAPTVSPRPPPAQRAVRAAPHLDAPNHDRHNPFQMMLTASQQQQQQQRPYAPLEGAGPHQGDGLYPGYLRHPRPPGAQEAGPKSPYYMAAYGGPLSPPPPGLTAYSEGPHPPAAAAAAGAHDTRGSPGDGLPGCYRTGPCGYPGPGSVHGNGRVAPPPPQRHGTACTMTGRTNTPLSKGPAAHGPRGAVDVRQAMDVPRGGAFHHHPPPPPACALQKRPVMTSSEKDPLGILGPIPGPQPGLHPAQVPSMNVNAPPLPAAAVVPLPSNLPVPTGKPGPAGHGHAQRPQQAVPSLSVSASPSSPVTPPVHLPGRTEATPLRSRPASTSLDHGGFAVPSGSGHPAHPGGLKAHPGSSPGCALGSPRPAVPSSPSSSSSSSSSHKADLLQQYLDSQVQSGSAQQQQQQHNHPMCSPPSSSPSVSSSFCSSSSSLSAQSASQQGHPGLLGVPLNQILNQPKAGSFPASSLLSAAAKAQLAYQSKHGPAEDSGGDASEAGTSRQPGFLSSPRGVEGHGAPNAMLPPGPAPCEAQSGRAALRDKLMAQQRDPARKRKLAPGAAAAAAAHPDGGTGMAYGAAVNPASAGGPRLPPGPALCDQLRQGPRMGGPLPPQPAAASMAHLLQSMSHQGSHAMASTGPPRGPPQRLLAQQRPRGPGPPALQPPHPHPHPHPQIHTGQGVMTQMHTSPLGSRGPARPGPIPGPLNGMPLGHMGPHPPPLSHPGPPPPQQSLLLHHGMRRPHVGAMNHGGGGGGGEGLVSTGNPSPLSCSMGGMQPLASSAAAQLYPDQLRHPPQPQFQQAMRHAGSPLPAHHPTHPYQGQQHFPDSGPYTEARSMPYAYQNYQGMMANHSQYGDARPQQQHLHRDPPGNGEGLPAGPPATEAYPGGPKAVDAIYRAVVDAARKGVHVTITTTLSGSTQAAPSTAFANAGMHGLREADATPRGRQNRGAPPQGTRDPPNGTPDPGDYFGSPGPWDGEPRRGGGGGGFDGQAGAGAAQWGGEEFLECSTQVRSGPCAERLSGLTPGPPCPSSEPPHGHREFYPDDGGGGGGYRPFDHTAAHGHHFASRGGYGEGLGAVRQELTADDQSPGSSTSLEGPLASGREYGGHYNGQYGGGGAVASPADTKSPSSEEELRRPDSPSSAHLLPYRSSRGFRVGEVLWGPLKGFPPWPARLAGDHQPLQHPREHVKVEPEKLKTLTHDLEAFERAAKRNRKPGKLNNHLEAAIHEAMSELDKMSGTIPSRDRQARPPKPKRRKISR